MATIKKTQEICEVAGLTYDGITIGITEEDAVKLQQEYNAYCLGITLDEYKKLILDHEQKIQEEYRNNKSKRKRFWR